MTTSTTIARQTGTAVTVGTADEFGLEPGEDGSCRWYTICEEHNSICGHRTRKLAQYFAASPIDWCEECREAQA